MTPSELMQYFMNEEAPLKDRMLKVRSKRKLVGPALVDMVTRLGHQTTREMDPLDMHALLPALYLLAEWREPYAYTEFSTFEAKLHETIDGNGVPAGGRYRQFLVSDAIADLLR